MDLPRVRAKHDFPGTGRDELSFQAGEEILRVNKVADAWWEGELNGQRGVFPANRVEVLIS